MKGLKATLVAGLIVTSSTANAGKWLSVGEIISVNLDHYGLITPTIIVDWVTLDCPNNIRINPALKLGVDKVILGTGTCAKSENDVDAKNRP
ncbi:hypothetical protein [Thiomicrorhabdus indica]|uniref:hypothetical protein n=1 Tax=Thiomicrorhabdus indica TaxID=2267253 RepID=UPI00102DF19F|nr:hypothetical protein [Thiomicrorhabdus indica]